MTLGSLKVRLLLVSALTILMSLVLAMGALDYIFRHHVEYRAYEEMENHLWQLVDAIEFDAEDKVVVSRQLADPRFDRPLSGLYWQVSEAGKPVASSQSLWDQSIAAPIEASSSPAKWLRLTGPEAAPVASIVRTVSISSDKTKHSLQLLVAINRAEIEMAAASFDRDIALSLGLIGLILAAGRVRPGAAGPQSPEGAGG